MGTISTLALLAPLIAAIAAFGAMIMTYITRGKLGKLEVKFDGHFDELLRLTREDATNIEQKRASNVAAVALDTAKTVAANKDETKEQNK